ncbi:hypothetical protein SAMN05216201_109169 [Pseudomonas linyingensis]|uniref:AAA domain-containing protein n=1 Tax=Pseudomonas linyingensis TaxID=915471 RepID=A0A1H6Z4X8_9PSED|nr:hypothetical protein [Pseudomonas linyingensis]SEJ48491.1 hypothetical protein SAMN05216201_109169 [Pseudomonas linyingensis]
MSLQRFVFNRPALAASLVRDLAGEGLADYSSGLFLTSPRGTGKSTFLKVDLIPQCEASGWLPVYVDLWGNKKTDPGDLIATAIAKTLSTYEGRLLKLTKSIGANKTSTLRALAWNLSKSELPPDATLAQALELLHQASDKLIVLIIDEAQLALNTDKGINAMFGLKAARDALNLGRAREGLRLIFTGSSRDKLANLVSNRSQPFYGASITTFPLLGWDYIEAYSTHVNARLAEGNQFSADDMADAFRMVGNRPELLAAIIKDVGLDIGDAGNLGQLLHSDALAIQTGAWGEYESAYNTLTPAQQAVLDVMADLALKKEAFLPYAETTLLAVGRALEQKGSDIQPTTTTIQNAIIGLRDKGLVWKSNRGEYALEDASMTQWLKRQQT